MPLAPNLETLNGCLSFTLHQLNIWDAFRARQARSPAVLSQLGGLCVMTPAWERGWARAKGSEQTWQDVRAPIRGSPQVQGTVPGPAQ